MHYFKETPADSDLLLSNLHLLNFDHNLANSTFRLQIDRLSLENVTAHPKLQICIIHFLIQLLVEDPDHYNSAIKSTYPPRSQLEQSLYKQEVAKYLKASTRIPKNFIITKTMLDTKIILFMRFLSEFTLRNQFMALFPQKQLKTFLTDPFKAFLEDRPCANDVNDIYMPASYQLEPHQSTSIPPQILKLITAQCGYQILKQTAKLKRLLSSNCEFNDSLADSIALVSEDFKKERERGIKLVQQLQLLKNDINPSYLSQERKLDRKPLLDSSFKTFKGIESILRQYQELRMDHNMAQLSSTSRLDRFDKENNLNTLYSRNIDHMNQTLFQIERVQQQTWASERGQNTLRQSQITLQRLQTIKASLLEK